MNGLAIDLKKVSSFVLVQADGPEGVETTVVDEKEFSDYQDALNTMKKSEAPVRYVRFYHNGDVYSLYPIEDSEEFTVVQKPLYN